MEISGSFVYQAKNEARGYGWPFLSIPRTLTATSNFEEDGFISISSTSKILHTVSNVILYVDVDVVEMKPPTRLHQIFEVDEIEMKPSRYWFLSLDNVVCVFGGS